MILVILGHCSWLSQFPFAYELIYAFHMPLFFIISGFFIKLDWKVAIKKYSKAYLKPYILTCMIILCMIDFHVILLGGSGIDLLNSTKHVMLRTFIASGAVNNDVLFASLPKIGVIWFLVALFWACLVYSILKLCLSVKKRLFVVVSLFVLTCISARYVRLPFSLQGGLSAVIFIMTGDLIRQYKVLDTFYRVHVLVKLLLLSICLYSVYCFGGVMISSCDYAPAIIKVMVAIVLSLIICDVFKTINIHGGWIGKSTLLILCGHQLVLRKSMFSNLPFNPILNILIEWLVGCGLAFLIGYILGRLPFFRTSAKRVE